MNAKSFRSRLPWNSRRGLFIWVFAGFAIPLAFMAWHIFGWPEPIVISYETTRLTEPLADTGLVDFLSVIRSDIDQAEDDFQNDPWLAIFANEREAKLPRTLIDTNRPHPPGTEKILYRHPVEFLKDSLGDAQKSIASYEQIRVFRDMTLLVRQRVPFTTDEDPIVAQAITANSDWYNAIRKFQQNAPLPVEFPGPKESQPRPAAGDIGLEIHQNCRDIADRFLLRSMHLAGEGDFSAAIADIDFIYRVAGRMDGLCMVATSCATSLELRAGQGLLMQILMADNLSDENCQRIEALPQGQTILDLARIIDRMERFIQLDEVQAMFYSKGQDVRTPFGFTGRFAYWKARRCWHATDWNRVLRKRNLFLDKLVATARLSTWRQQSMAIQTERIELNAQPQQVINADEVPPWSAWDPTDWLIYELNKASLFTWEPIAPTHARDLRRRVVQIVARLARWRQIHGQFPKKLSAVLQVQGFSAATTDLLVDPFSGSDLLYQATDAGFVLKSVGKNMNEETNGFEECSIREPDYFKMNPADDDYIWRWPAAD